MTQYKVFIDNGQVKIVDYNGREYETEIAYQSHLKNTFSQALNISAFVLFVSIMLAISPFYFEFLSNVQAIVFAILAITSLSLMIFSGQKLNGTHKSHLLIVQEYNLAKEALQPEIAQLQKQVRMTA